MQYSWNQTPFIKHIYNTSIVHVYKQDPSQDKGSGKNGEYIIHARSGSRIPLGFDPILPDTARHILGPVLSFPHCCCIFKTPIPKTTRVSFVLVLSQISGRHLGFVLRACDSLTVYKLLQTSHSRIKPNDLHSNFDRKPSWAHSS